MSLSRRELLKAQAAAVAAAAAGMTAPLNAQPVQGGAGSLHWTRHEDAELHKNNRRQYGGN
jgi:hypothetical protein